MSLTVSQPRASLAWCLPSQLASELGVHHATVLRWCHLGEIPAWQTPSGHWRIAREMAERLIAEAHAASTGSAAAPHLPTEKPAAAAAGVPGSTMHRTLNNGDDTTSVLCKKDRSTPHAEPNP